MFLPLHFMLSKRLKFLILRSFSNLLFIIAGVLFLMAAWPYLKDEISYRWFKLRGITFSLEGKAPSSRFAYLISQPTPLRITPASKDFGIVIEKINVNAPVVKNVSIKDEAEYKLALREGVAHAKGTKLPGKAGNSFLFAHSSLDFWALGKYSTVFNLLRKLEKGDKIVVFYQDKRFDYKVSDKKVVSRTDLSPLLAKYDEPVLTLQTCYPPGTTFNRLIVIADLID